MNSIYFCLDNTLRNHHRLSQFRVPSPEIGNTFFYKWMGGFDLFQIPSHLKQHSMKSGIKLVESSQSIMHGHVRNIHLCLCIENRVVICSAKQSRSHRGECAMDKQIKHVMCRTNNAFPLLRSCCLQRVTTNGLLFYNYLQVTLTAYSTPTLIRLKHVDSIKTKFIISHGSLIFLGRATISIP